MNEYGTFVVRLKYLDNQEANNLSLNLSLSFSLKFNNWFAFFNMYGKTIPQKITPETTEFIS